MANEIEHLTSGFVCKLIKRGVISTKNICFLNYDDINPMRLFFEFSINIVNKKAMLCMAL
jgi:hypothetical protein